MEWSRSRSTTVNPKADKFVNDIKSGFLLDRSADPDAFVSKLKPLFKECAELRSVPVANRGQVLGIQIAALMELVDFDTGAVLITEGNATPDFYIVLKGLLEARSSRAGSFRHGIQIRQFEVCGFATPLTQVDWVNCSVKALEPTEAILIRRDDLVSFVSAIEHIKETAELKDFVISTVPGARYLGQGGKEKIISYFEKCVFKKDDRLLREGQVSDFAYIIRTGECLKTTSSAASKPKRLSPAKGFKTKTTEHLVLSLVTAKQWAGEECLLYDTPLEYSLVATNLVSALRIHKTNFLERLPKETIQALKQHVDSKRHWRALRQNRVKDTLQQAVYGPEDDEFTKALYKNSRHPAASKAASLSLLKQHVMDRSSESSSPIRGLLSQNNSFFVTDKPRSAMSRRSPEKMIETNSSRPSTSMFRGESDSPVMTKVYYGDYKSPFAIKTPELRATGLAFSSSPIKSVRRAPSPTKVGCRSVREHFGYIDPEPPAEPESYVLKVIKPRPASPNPSEVWTRRYGIDRNSLSNVRTHSASKASAHF